MLLLTTIKKQNKTTIIEFMVLKLSGMGECTRLKDGFNQSCTLDFFTLSPWYKQEVGVAVSVVLLAQAVLQASFVSFSVQPFVVSSCRTHHTFYNTLISLTSRHDDSTRRPQQGEGKWFISMTPPSTPLSLLIFKSKPWSSQGFSRFCSGLAMPTSSIHAKERNFGQISEHWEIWRSPWSAKGLRMCRLALGILVYISLNLANSVHCWWSTVLISLKMGLSFFSFLIFCFCRFQGININALILPN